VLLCLSKEIEPVSELCIYKELDGGQSKEREKERKKEERRLSTSFIPSSVLDILTLKMGPIGCPKTSVINYHSVLHNMPQESRSHRIIWNCGPWFGSHGPVHSDPFQRFVHKFKTASHI
jgi:hypothetical protein